MAEINKGDGLVKLSRSGDFEAWQFKMQLHLRGLGIFNIVDGSKPAVPKPVQPKPENDFGKEDENPAPAPVIDKQAVREWREYRTRRDVAVATIIQGLTNELSKRFRNKEYLDNPVLVWHQLEQDHKNKVKLDVQHLRTHIRNIRLEECRSVDVYIHKFQNLCDQIAMAGPPITDTERCYEMMNGLPSEWTVSKEIMATRVTSTEAWEELIPFFLAMETELREECNIPADSVLYSKHWKKGKG